MKSLHELIHDFTYDLLEALVSKVAEGGEDTVMSGVRVLDEPEKFVHGHLINLTIKLLVKYHIENDSREEITLKRLYYFLGLIKGTPCHTWGKITLLRGMSSLYDAGLMHILNDDIIEMLKEKTNYEDFLDKSTITLINQPSNYYQVALACAGYREKIGWEDGGYCQKILNKLVSVMQTYSDCGFMDEQPPLGRFDRYTLIVASETINTLDAVGQPAPQFILDQVKYISNALLFMANSRGDGINYGRSLSCHGDCGVLLILGVALRHKLIEKENIDLAVAYSIKIAEKTMNFWFNKEIGLFDIWFNGRSTNQYRQVHRILEVNLDMSDQLLKNLRNFKEAGYDKYVPDIKLPTKDEWQASKIVYVKEEDKERTVYLIKKRDMSLMLPLIGAGRWWRCAAYMPFPVLNGRIEAPPESFLPFLAPFVTLRDGTKAAACHYFSTTDIIEERGKITITAEGNLTTLETNGPTMLDSKFSVIYTFVGDTISSQFTFDNSVADIEMQFAYAGAKRYIEGIGFDSEHFKAVTGNKEYFTPHGGLDNAIIWSAKGCSTVGYTINLE
ncbi:MAG: hypothetical protein PHE51_07010 [Eubacteriales bacterium]|nr:hypothetical protein [Eubacteriales bacterium]